MKLEPKPFRNNHGPYVLLVKTMEQRLTTRPNLNRDTILIQEQAALGDCSPAQCVYYYCVLAGNLSHPSVNRAIEALAIADCALMHAGKNVKLQFDALVVKGICHLSACDEFALITFEQAAKLNTRGLFSHSSINILALIGEARRMKEARTKKAGRGDFLAIPAQRAPMM